MFSVHILTRCLTSRVRPICITGLRSILSEAYLCDEVWQKRLDSPLLKDIKLDQYFIETDKKFNTKELVSGIEIDLFASKIEETSRLEELEHLLFRFRRTKRAAEMLESTHYAVVKAFLKCKEYESLMRILTHPESYGVFPNLYTYNILMSSFLNEKYYIDAAKVAILMMLQESFENKISCVLGVYTCQLFLNECSLNDLNPDVVKDEETQTNEDENEEEVRLVRVPYLRNPWFDDHFDITDPKHLIGKTLYLLGRQIATDCGRSYQLIGLAMYEKWDKAYALLNGFCESKDKTVFNEAILKLKAHIDEIPDDENNTKSSLEKKFEPLIEKMKSQNQIKDGDLMSSLASELKAALSTEADDIEAQKQQFPIWEEQRHSALQHLNATLEKERRLKAVEEKKEYLYWKEKKLFFFENEDKNLEELKQAEEVVSQLKEKKMLTDTYVPPEIVKKRPQRLTKYQKLTRVKKI